MRSPSPSLPRPKSAHSQQLDIGSVQHAGTYDRVLSSLTAPLPRSRANSIELDKSDKRRSNLSLPSELNSGTLRKKTPSLSNSNVQAGTRAYIRGYSPTPRQRSAENQSGSGIARTALPITNSQRPKSGSRERSRRLGVTL